MILDNFEYEVIENVRDGFKEEDVMTRYSDILGKYDYIVGDWGYGQLRLKGFYDDKNTKATYDTKISTFEDYLYEYCNFGCAYFILKKGKKVEAPLPVEEIQEVQQPIVEEVQLEVEAEPLAEAETIN